MYQLSMTEFIDFIQSDVTVGGALPKNLPDQSIQQFVETRAAKWFYQNYQYAVSKMYYLVNKDAFNTDEYTKYKHIELPCEIQSISWIYKIMNTSLLQLGINVPNLFLIC